MDPVVVAAINVEYLNTQSVVIKKLQFKNGLLRLIRNPIRELFLEVTQDKMMPLKLKLKDINVHKKFMSDGKATIGFKNDKCNLYIANAAPSSLMLFLKTLYIKMTTDTEENKGVTKEEMHKKLRAHLLSEKSSNFDEISPVTNSQLAKAKKQAISKSTLTTPSPGAKKRKLEGINHNDNPKSSKQLYTAAMNEKAEKKSTTNRFDPDEIANMDALNEEQDEVLQGNKQRFIYLFIFFNTNTLQKQSQLPQLSH
jgi:ATP-dependent DNA helicase PIF1